MAYRTGNNELYENSVVDALQKYYCMLIHVCTSLKMKKKDFFHLLCLLTTILPVRHKSVQFP